MALSADYHLSLIPSVLQWTCKFARGEPISHAREGKSVLETSYRRWHNGHCGKSHSQSSHIKYHDGFHVGRRVTQQDHSPIVAKLASVSMCGQDTVRCNYSSLRFLNDGNRCSQVITKCLNQSDGEKLIRKWTLLVLQSLTSCRPDNLSVWATTVVLVASGSSFRSCLRAL